MGWNKPPIAHIPYKPFFIPNMKIFLQGEKSLIGKPLNMLRKNKVQKSAIHLVIVTSYRQI